MTLVGWLADAGNADGTIGGAELTQAAFKAAAPDHVEVIDMPAGQVFAGPDLFVAHNVVGYSLDDLQRIDAQTFWYHHDVGPHVPPEVRDWMDFSASNIYCSPLQRDFMGGTGELIPPMVPLDPFREAAESAQERIGAVAIGPWMNPAKAPDAAAEWASGNGGITFLGGGPFAPDGSKAVAYEDLPEILADFKTFVHLPREIEPFGRSTVEAWAAGCEVIVNKLVGSAYWIAEAPEKLESAADDFWSLVLN